jgi:hypothetical protein
MAVIIRRSSSQAFRFCRHGLSRFFPLRLVKRQFVYGLFGPGRQQGVPTSASRDQLSFFTSPPLFPFPFPFPSTKPHPFRADLFRSSVHLFYFYFIFILFYFWVFFALLAFFFSYRLPKKKFKIKKGPPSIPPCLALIADCLMH